MYNNFAKLFSIIIILSFFIIVFNYYFSDQNVNLVKNKRNSLESETLVNHSELPVLFSDTNNVIEFNSGFENTKKQNYKRNFWELFK
tara:strand:+ start:1775 stop:2035 length:261 start_codon:yes stop_codon:yes gene_type:complete